MAMTIPFIFSPDGITPSGVGATILAALNLRLATVTYASTPTVISALGRNWVAGTWDGDFYIDDQPKWIGFRMYSTQTGITASRGFVIRGAASAHLYFWLSSAGLTVYRVSTLLTTIALGGANTVFVEVFFDTDNTFDIYINGGLSPSYSSTATTAPVAIGARETMAWRDVYAWNTRLGEGSARLLPLGTQVSNTGTVTNAADAAAALLAYDDATKYVTYAAGQKSLVNVADIADNPVSIACVQVTALGKKTGTALLPEQIKLVTGSEANIGSPVLAVSNSGQRAVALTDPHDSAAWTKAKINAMQVGVGSA